MTTESLKHSDSEALSLREGIYAISHYLSESRCHCAYLFYVLVAFLETLHGFKKWLIYKWLIH